MKHFLPSLIIILCYRGSTLCQNLVPNPGFEEFTGSPIKGHVHISSCKDWFSGYMMATDYFNRKFAAGEAVPTNDQGSEEPHGGDAYAGICINTRYVEYLGARLLSPLKSGSTYQIELFVSRAEISMTSVDEFGIVFTDRQQRTFAPDGIEQEPDVKLEGEGHLHAKKGWTRLTATYAARGDEAYLILGHFIYGHRGHYRGSCHYYVDDVSIAEISGDAGEEVSASPSSEESDAAPATFATGEAVVLKNIIFPSDQSELLPASFPELDKLALYLLRRQDILVEISGHTDNTGAESQNRALSEARAKAVTQYLISKKVDRARITYKGFGSSKPVATNNTGEGKKQNRRVEFTITQQEE